MGRVRSHHPEEPAEEWRREGHGDVRCRKAAGKSDEEEDKEGRSRLGEAEGTARRQDGGEEEKRGSDGVNCRRQGHRLYLALKPPIRAFGVTLARYSSCVVFPSSLSLLLALSLALHTPRRVAPLPLLPHRQSPCGELRIYIYAHAYTTMRVHMCIRLCARAGTDTHA